jgi:hypothetical protein
MTPDEMRDVKLLLRAAEDFLEAVKRAGVTLDTAAQAAQRDLEHAVYKVSRIVRPPQR